MNNIENEIIKGLAAGNRHIFNIVFKSFYNTLCAYARELVKSYEVAEELVQEVFIKLWENHARLQIQTSLKAYLYRSVYNTCLNYIRDTRKHVLHQVNIDQPGLLEALITEEPEWISDPDRLDKIEETLRNAIQQLPEQCHQIFVLSRYKHLSYPQIAEMLSISLSTVKTQMGRAMAKLKEALDEMNGNG